MKHTRTSRWELLQIWADLVNKFLPVSILEATNDQVIEASKKAKEKMGEQA